MQKQRFRTKTKIGTEFRVPKLCILYLLLTSTLKVKSDHRSKFSNLSNWKEEA